MFPENRIHRSRAEQIPSISVHSSTHTQTLKNCGLLHSPLQKLYWRKPQVFGSTRFRWTKAQPAGQTKGPAWNIMFDPSARLISITKVSAPPTTEYKCSVIKLMDFRSECTAQSYTFLIWHKAENYGIVGHFTQRSTGPTIVSIIIIKFVLLKWNNQIHIKFWTSVAIKMVARRLVATHNG